VCGVGLNATLAHTASVIFDQVIDWFYPAFLRLSRVNSTGGVLLFGCLLLHQIGFEVSNKNEVIIILFVILAVVLFVLPASALGSLRPFTIVDMPGVYFIGGGLSEFGISLG
jgi:hypothetical protein